MSPAKIFKKNIMQMKPALLPDTFPQHSSPFRSATFHSVKIRLSTKLQFYRQAENPDLCCNLKYLTFRIISQEVRKIKHSRNVSDESATDGRLWLKCVHKTVLS